jgi:hypothetical protein
MLLVVLLVGAACGSSTGKGVAATTSTTTAPQNPVAAKFCSGWPELTKTQDESRADSLLGNPPPEIADAVRVIRSSGDVNTEPDAADSDDAWRDVTAWVEVHCNGDSKQRHVAPPFGADLAGLALCEAGGRVPLPSVDQPGDATDVVLFGEVDRADPYDGPMIGLFTKKSGQGGYAGDGDPTPVTVRGKAGVAAPITVFQQSIVPELGTVIAWTEGGRDVGLYGRLWTKERADALVALANRLELRDGRLAFDTPPDGYEQVFAGSADPSWSLIGDSLLGDYHVTYQGSGGRGLLTLAGRQLTEEQFDGFRFFALPIPHVQLGDHDARFGSAWSKDKGPYVATWRDPDGFTVRITSIGGTGDQARAVAEQSRELDRSEWARLVLGANGCDTPDF